MAEVPATDRRDDLGFGGAIWRAPPTPGGMARRRWLVGAAKRLLPVAALALLASVALWPELARLADRTRLAGSRLIGELQTGLMLDATYHGVDERGRPFTVTAARAREVGDGRLTLEQPKADVATQDGRWLLVQSRGGTYVQRAGNLDLAGDVQLYRDDGTVLQTDAANIDLKAGAAASAEKVHAEGPFGTLDAQGFVLTDRGAAIQFTGPGRLLLNVRK